MRVFGALLVVLMLTSCAQEPAELNPSPSQTATETRSEDTEAPTESEPSGPEPCAEVTQIAIEEVIDSQVAAFANEEYDLAYSFASAGFRSSVSLDEFILIIDGSYGPLVQSASLVYSECLTDPQETVGIIIANFIQPNNEVLAIQYLMVNLQEGWRVQGASDLRVVGEGA